MAGIRRFRREKIIEEATCAAALKTYGVPNLAIKLALGTTTGWPDRLFFVGGGAILLIEFKDPTKGKVSPKQDYIHTMLKGLGYDVQVHDNKDEALHAIRAAQVDAAQVSKKNK